jgi:hypothetical protein
MTTASESRAALQVVTATAVASSLDLLGRLNGSPIERRAGLLYAVPEIVGYYSEGSAALAADFYEEERDIAGVRKRFVPELVVLDRTEKLRRAVAWSAAPLFADDLLTASSRLAEVVQLDVARAYRDTITTNRRRDPEAVGWRRIAAGGCKFCQMLAANGAIYRHDTARFAAHPNCHCTAQPVFAPNDTGEEASALQYIASKRTRTDAEKARLRDHLNSFFPDFPG